MDCGAGWPDRSPSFDSCSNRAHSRPLLQAVRCDADRVGSQAKRRALSAAGADASPAFARCSSSPGCRRQTEIVDGQKSKQSQITENDTTLSLILYHRHLHVHA